MAELTTAQFADFFRAVHDHEPFDWQKLFAEQVPEGGGWPDVIRVPTGCGKTSVLDVAVFELALRAVRLRGGVYRDDGWAADPLTPTILISTVDQIGSRLLFRGYGVGRGSRPVHAGLLAFDTRIILGEAHLSTAFAETLDRIREYQNWAEQSPLPAGRRVSVVRMSATAGEGAELPFELTDAERQDARLKPRLEASKPAKLIEV